jgi:fatty acyl-CoA reductase
MYPKFRYTTNRSIHFLYELFLHFLPAFLADLVLRMQGKKAIMLKISKRFKMAADTGEYFSMHEWIFGVNNIHRMIRAAQETQLDANEFNCDINDLDWNAYIEKYILGIRQFVLKDDMSSLPKARRKLQKIIWVRRIFYMLLLGATLYLLLNGLWN